ncbi:MAG: sugar ABC transporter permease, partial [Bdellovibrionota bacterium]|nr:sugar ABC transporter permease [Bdellovibrionota bacterium]
MLSKRKTQKAWFLVLPVFLVVAFSAVIPLMTVVNYSFQDIMGPHQRVFVGWEWFREVLQNTELHGAFFRQLLFSFLVLLIQIPLGVGVALLLPTKGKRVSVCLILLAMPLLIPHNVVGMIWQILGRGDIGLLGYTLKMLGINYNYANNASDAWWTVLVMDVWH